MNSYIIGLDIGSSKICAAAGKIGNNGELQIVGVVSEKCNGLKKSIVVDIDSTSSAIISCIKKLERIIDDQIDEVYVSLPGAICTLKNSKGVVAIASDDREIKQNDIDRVLESSKMVSVPYDKEIIGVIPKQYIVDGHGNIKDPLGMSGLKLEVDSQLIISEANVVNNLIKSVEKSNLTINGITLKPYGLFSLIARKDEQKRGLLIIDAGYETIEVSYFYQGILKDCQMVPLGGNSITNDISVCLKIPLEDAEKLKVKFSTLFDNVNSIKEYEDVVLSNGETTSIDLKLLNNVVEARIEELLNIIKNNLMMKDYYEDISKIILVGGGFSLIKGINDYSKRLFNKPVNIGIPQYVGAGNPMYTVAVGIVKDVADTIKFNNRLDYNKSELKENTFYANNKVKNTQSNKVVSKIKDFLAEFF